jgi:hypothetical protein
MDWWLPWCSIVAPDRSDLERPGRSLGQWLRSLEHFGKRRTGIFAHPPGDYSGRRELFYLALLSFRVARAIIHFGGDFWVVHEHFLTGPSLIIPPEQLLVLSNPGVTSRG